MDIHVSKYMIDKLIDNIFAPCPMYKMLNKKKGGNKHEVVHRGRRSKSKLRKLL